MSYYGASGTKHLYVATDQPLYGLGNEPVMAGKRIQSTADNPALMAHMAALESATVSKALAEESGIACLGVRDPYNEYNNIRAVQAFKLWQSMGKFVVLKRKNPNKNFCDEMHKLYGATAMPTGEVMAWTGYAYPPENIGSLLDDPDAYVWGLPFGEMSWDKYAKFIPVAGGGTATKTPPPPPVITDPPKVEIKNGVPVAAESGISLVHVAIGAAAIFVAWKLFGGGHSYEANLDEYEENCWE